MLKNVYKIYFKYQLNLILLFQIEIAVEHRRYVVKPELSIAFGKSFLSKRNSRIVYTSMRP